MDAMQAAYEARKREESSRKLQDRAKTDPKPAGKGGAFQSNAPGSGSDKAADASGKYDGGLSGGVIHSADQEQNIQNKASSGGVITNDDIDGRRAYLGHMKSDEVMAQGHNAMGKKYLMGGDTARRGFRKLPGTGANQIGHARFGHAPTGLPPTRAERLQSQRMTEDMMAKGLIKKSDIIPLSRDGGFGSPRAVADVSVGPKFKSDLQLSIKHHKASIANDMQHAKDHMVSAKKHKKDMAVRMRQLKKK